MDEVWKDVSWCCQPGFYQISNLGKAKSLDRNVICKDGKTKKLKGKLLKPKMCGNYYAISINGTNRYIHTLVARAFPEICGEWFRGCQVDHIDTNIYNNSASNLRICTARDNHRNPLTRKHLSESKTGNIPWNKGKQFTSEQRKNISNSLIGKYTYAKNPNSKPILQLTLDDEVIKEWDCIKTASETLGINRTNISGVLAGRHNTAGGFKWIYVKKSSQHQLDSQLPEQP